MSEWFLQQLLRLYPREFQRAYGADALQLIRDRYRDERSIVLRWRLCLDILADLLAVTLQRLLQAKPLVSSEQTYADRTPSFTLDQSRSPRLKALAAGMVASAVMFAAFTQMFHPVAPDDRRARLLASLFHTGPAQSSGSAPQSTDATSAHRQKLIETVAVHLKQHYFDAAVGQRLSEALLDHDRKGDYDSLAPGPEFVARINTHIRETSRALGIPTGAFVADVVYSERPIPQGPPPLSAEARERNRSTLLQQNCLLERTELLPRNIGYLKLNGFPDASVCGPSIDAAMKKISNADALIVDLRDNSGGFGGTALQIASFLFARPTYLYDPRANTQRSSTTTPVSGSSLVDKPVYVLTSTRTLSAAEYFAYNLKMLKRATIVGETTGGGQHSGVFKRIDDHFGIGIQQTAPPSNPFPVKGWEAIGVEPDVKVPRAAAFDAARKLAESQVPRR